MMRKIAKFNQHRGFSLVEMMVVIALMAIALAIAAPSFTRYRDNANLREAVRDISSDISLFKQRAISENVRYYIEFSAGNNNYTIFRETSLNSNDFILVATKVIGGGNPAISISGAPNFAGGTRIWIQPRGTVTPGNVVLTHSGLVSTGLTPISTIRTTFTGRVYVE